MQAVGDVSKVQGPQVEFALHTLGWKAFQDLCVAAAIEVLDRPVQTFLSSKDGGRDGAFVGTWDGAEDSPANKSTIQCKFVGRADAKLSLANLTADLRKVSRLANRGLAHDYIILTNARITGEAEAEISKAFEDAGAEQCRVFGYDWLTQVIRTSPRLRMMVPRLYGLGDLSQIIDERAYAQAKYVLSAMGDDLRCFVITEAHRKSVTALTKHGFVLLLGDPASGKSTIGASLAIGALDTGSIGTIRAASPDDFQKHWNPYEPNQFFWVDDAFGATQYQRSLVDSWNRELPLLRAAIKAGTRVLFTSRNYIWEAAKRDIKISQFPLLGQSQVVINVQNLSETERAQILYNHIRSGDQPKNVRTTLKPHLADVARNRTFLPETARRLGSRFFTSGLLLDKATISNFVEHPVEFLKDVLRNLDEASRAAIAIIFLAGAGGVPSPVAPSEALETVCRLFGLVPASVARGLEHLGGSLTLLIESETGNRWTYKHPTIADAFASLVAESPELVELYVHGAKMERLLSEVVCGDVQIRGAPVRVPVSLYPRLLDRMKKHSFDTDMRRFLTNRCDRYLRLLYFNSDGLIDKLIRDMYSELAYDSSANLLAKLLQDGILSEDLRSEAAQKIMKLTMETPDGAIFDDDDIRSLLTDEEFQDALVEFKREIADRLDDYAWELESSIISGDIAGALSGLKDNIDRYVRFQESTEEGVSCTLIQRVRKIEERVSELEEESPPRHSTPTAPKSSVVDEIGAIFDDVDD